MSLGPQGLKLKSLLTLSRATQPSSMITITTKNSYDNTNWVHANDGD